MTIALRKSGRAPNKSGYLVTVIYLAEIDATVEDASDTEIPDLANIDITGPANEGSVYVGDIAASGGTGDYSYTKLASGGGELSVDDNGQVFIPASAEPTAGRRGRSCLLWWMLTTKEPTTTKRMRSAFGLMWITS